VITNTKKFDEKTHQHVKNRQESLRQYRGDGGVAEKVPVFIYKYTA